MVKADAIDQESIVRIITKADRLIDAGTKIGVAYFGYKSNNHWSGALVALIALKLAESGNVVSGASGVGVLTYIGLTQTGLLTGTYELTPFQKSLYPPQPG